MARKKKQPEIKPLYVKNDKGKKTAVYLDYHVYVSILDEIKEFEKIKKKNKRLLKK